jgi:glucose-6-phosphate 1-dehydrogenase
MEPPSSFSADHFHDEQVKVLEAVPGETERERAATAVRGQYGPGYIAGNPVPGYRREPKVAPDSTTETYVAVKLKIDNWRWAGVPFYLRSGKRLTRRRTEIAVQFRNPPLSLFRKGALSMPEANRILIEIQPEESIVLEFEAKVPGPMVRIDPVAMSFAYRDYFGRALHTGYETLLYDAMIGDSSLFKRADIIDAGWCIVQPLLDAWAEGGGHGLCFYPAGSEGPVEADELLRREGREWRPLA